SCLLDLGHRPSHLARPMSSGRKELFPNATDAEWRDWRWQLRHGVRSLAELERYIRLTDGERRGCAETSGIFRLGISPYYLSLIDPDHPYCPVRMQSIPVDEEAHTHPGELRDPLLLATARLRELLEQIRSVPHVEIVRIGTRIPVCLPMRVDDELARALRTFAPLFVVTHFNHAKEITPEAREACARLIDHGIP